MSDEADQSESLRRSPVSVPMIRVPTARLPEVDTPGEKTASRLVRYPNASSALRSLLQERSPKASSLEPRARVDLARGSRGGLVERPAPWARSKPSQNALRLIRESVGRPVREQLTTARPPLPRVEATQIVDGAGLGQMVRIRRQMLKLSQKDLADRAGVGRRFIGELEGGKPSAELGKALAVCRTLGLTLTLQAADGR